MIPVSCIEPGDYRSLYPVQDMETKYIDKESLLLSTAP